MLQYSTDVTQSALSPFRYRGAFKIEMMDYIRLKLFCFRLLGGPDPLNRNNHFKRSPIR
jgi:hypothetical protein